MIALRGIRDRYTDVLPLLYWAIMWNDIKWMLFVYRIISLIEIEIINKTLKNALEFDINIQVSYDNPLAMEKLVAIENIFD